LIEKKYNSSSFSINLKVLIEGNPVDLNPNSQIIIKEIITVIKLKKNLKNRNSTKTLATLATSDSLTYRKFYNQTQPAYIKINQNKSFANTDKNELAQSAPNKYSINDKTRQRSSTLRHDNKRRLKPNVIFIEQDNDEQNTERVTDDIENVANSLSSATLQLNKYSKSFSGHYDPNKLKQEIEMMKKMRQSYGTDWLLSTPNLNSNSLNINNSSNFLISSKTNTTQSNSNNQTLDENSKNKLSINEINNVIDSFAVYRSIEPISNSNLNDDQIENALDSSIIICILSLTDLYIVEKDETNMELLSINKYSDLADIKIINE
jgi:hypothetical protein